MNIGIVLAMKTGDKVQLIISVILCVMLIISCIGLKVVKKRQANDPGYKKRMEEHRKELNRIAQEDNEINNYFASDSLDYADNAVDIDNNNY